MSNTDFLDTFHFQVARPAACGVAPRDRVTSAKAQATPIRFLLLLVPFITLFFSTSNVHAAPRKATISTALNVNQLRAGENSALAVTIDVPQGLHAQSNKPLDESLIPLVVTINDGPIKAVNTIYREGTIEEYPALGKVSVYTGKVTVYAILSVPKDAPLGAATIAGSVRYQMCDDKTCFAPMTEKFTVSTMIAAPGAPVTPASAELFAALDPAVLTAVPATRPAITAPPAAAANADGPQSLLGAIGFAILAGIIFNVMPCVLPVLPLKAVGFYEASHHNRSRTILFGVSFSVGMTAIFALLAAMILLSKAIIGKQIVWGQLFSYGWFVWTIAIVLGLLALSMLRGAAIRLPTSIYGLNFRHDTMIGNFMWGGLTAILSTPCTAFFFPVILGWALGQPLLSGFIAITMVGVGMALPYLILSAFPELARKFPRTGPFAELFKQMMGFLLLASAGFFFGLGLLRDPNQWWLVFAIIVIAGIYLIVRTRQILPSPRATAIAVGIALVLISGGFVAAQKLTRPTKGFIYYTPEALAEARGSGDVVLVKFTASWCFNCKYVEQNVYQNEQTLIDLQSRQVRMLKADLTSDDAPGWKLLNELGGTGIPFTAVWPTAKDAKPLVLESIYGKEALLNTVDTARSSPVAITTR